MTDAPPRGGALDGVWLSLGTLTALRVPAPRVVDAAAARTAMLLAPLAALVPAGAAAAVYWACREAQLRPALTALLALATVALMTRGLHLDGLADTADGLAAGYDRSRALDVMRRGDVGPAGAVTLLLVLAVQAAALVQAVSQVVVDGHAAGVRGGVAGSTVVLVGFVAGRAVLPVACARGIPAARPGGLGATVAGSVPVAAAVLVVGAVAALAATGTALVGAGPLPGAAAVLASVAAALLVLRRCVRRLGGVTGDVLGACVEAGTTAALVALAATTV